MWFRERARFHLRTFTCFATEWKITRSYVWLNFGCYFSWSQSVSAINPVNTPHLLYILTIAATQSLCHIILYLFVCLQMNQNCDVSMERAISECHLSRMWGVLWKCCRCDLTAGTNVIQSQMTEFFVVIAVSTKRHVTVAYSDSFLSPVIYILIIIIIWEG
jgi:hypothetical protein